MEYEFNSLLLGGGLVLGLMFGAIVQKSGFCMSAVVSNFVLMRDCRQLHAFLIAIAIAVSGTQLLNFMGLVDIGESAYLTAKMNWCGAIAGGLVFGFGTILAGGCIGRTVVRAGEGNSSAMIALIFIAVAATATMYGPLEPYRVWLYQATVIDIPAEWASIPGLFDFSAGLFSVFFVCVCLAMILLTYKKNRSVELLFAGGALGLLIVAGWWVTGYLSQDIFSLHRPASLTYAGPLANTGYMLVTGSVLSDSALFGLTLLTGTLLGSFLMARITGRFRWTRPDSTHLCHIVVGGLLMGAGAIVAGGCNIGNGLTGLSVLSVRSLIAVIAIFSGMRLGVYWLVRSEALEKQHHWYSFMHKA
ncbi:MAG TPA: YeeE/YedE family protein [Gammaproteobacteria bacterium]|nr:YeeE/YedE family protein [Gammaproteobacteria bacterium]